MKRCILCLMTIIIVMSLSVTMNVYADSIKVVTLGNDLSTEQRELMLSYFGVNEKQVEVVNVSNSDERKYLEGIATTQQIGRKTYSCTYIEPTESGGINIKTANLTWVTSDMIRNALITSGITNCNVVAASPIEVSGTGSLAGIFMAYESIDSDDLDEAKTELASEELVATMNIANSTGQDEASNMLSLLKEKVLIEKLSSEDSILKAVNNYINDMNIEITEEQKWQLVELLLKISQQDYDIDEIKQIYEDMRNTVENIQETTEETMNFLEKLWNGIKELINNIKSLFSKADETLDKLEDKANDVKKDLGIISSTDDSLLGQEAVITSTEQTEVINSEQESKDKKQGEQEEGFWSTLLNKVKSVFTSNETEEENEEQSKAEDNSVSENDITNKTGVLDEVIYETEEDTKPLTKPTLDELTGE